MPELVEVEAARHLCEKVLGKKVSRAWIKPDENKVITFPCTELASDITGLQEFLTGCVVRKAVRKGKQLALKVEKGGVEAWLFVHLGMAGSIVVEGEKQLAYKSFTIDADEWPPRHAKIELEFDGGARWAFCDMRRFGKVFLSETDAPFADLAPDGLLELPDEQDWVAALRKQKICLKALLLDQKRLVCGVGNWIADEVLYQAKLHPDLPSNSLSPEASLELRRCLNHVLEEGCRRNGETFPEHWLFNYRWGKASSKAQTDFHGNPIVHITSGGRTSAVVPKIQGDAPTSSKGAPATPPKGASGATSSKRASKGKGEASSGGKAAAKGETGGGKRNGKTAAKGKASAGTGPPAEKGGGGSRKRKAASEDKEDIIAGSRAAVSNKGKGAAASSQAARKEAAAAAATGNKNSKAASGGAKGAAKGVKAESTRNARTTRSSGRK